MPSALCIHPTAAMRALAEILVVEDEIEPRESVQEALEQAGYRVAAARNGLEALSMLNGMDRPALIVLVLQMPLMDGLAFLRELRSRPDHAEFEVLAMSATVDGEWVHDIPGVRRTLRKPFDVDELLQEAEAFQNRSVARAASASSTAAEQAAPVLGAETKAAGPEVD